MAGHAAIRYHAASFDTRVGKMMGRQAVGGAFLKAWIAHAGADPLTAWVDDAHQEQAFRAHAVELGAAMPIAVAGPPRADALVQAGALLVGDPALAPFAWARRYGAEDRWSLIGITHTIASHEAMGLIADCLTAPVQRWDALICTSRAVKAVVTRVLEDQADYLIDRLGAHHCAGPELPVIPLGVDCAAHVPDPAARTRWRDRLGLGADDVAVLQLGRLALHAKAHPVPLYLALAAAGRAAARRPHLILAGLFANPGQETLYRALADRFAGEVATHFVDGRDPEFASILSGADIFTLLADNLQESFGVAPVEAMAAGLPVVGSDWDGLRDTIEHGVTGFRIDTLQPPAGDGRLNGQRYDSGADGYDAFVGGAGQATAVDVAGAARAFTRLIAEPGLRRSMGAAGLARARSLYDWPVVIRIYRALLDELAARRAAGGIRAPRRAGAPPRPGRDDPFRGFAAYPTAALSDDAPLVAVPGAGAIADVPGGSPMTVVVPQLLPDSAVLEALHARLTEGAATVAALAGEHPAIDRATLRRGVLWLIKYGFVARA